MTNYANNNELRYTKKYGCYGMTPLMGPEFTDDDDDDLSNLEWSIANTVASSKLGGTMIVDEIANSLRVETVVNMLVLSIGYHNDDEVTVGLFGHVWTIYDFMSSNRIAHEINDSFFDD